MILRSCSDNKKKRRNKRGQAISEVALIFGIITAILITFTPYIKRSIQGMIKVATDQIGNQARSDQDFTSAYTASFRNLNNENRVKQIEEDKGAITYTYGDTTTTEIDTGMYLGESEQSR